MLRDLETVRNKENALMFLMCSHVHGSFMFCDPSLTNLTTVHSAVSLTCRGTSQTSETKKKSVAAVAEKHRKKFIYSWKKDISTVKFLVRFCRVSLFAAIPPILNDDMTGLTSVSKMIQNRKRGRSLQEEEVEFMPLSKRINNLHINNPMLLENSFKPLEWNPDQSVNVNDIPSSPKGSDGWSGPQYTPDLNESQNPHYFNVNKLLFEMYVLRMQRGCSQ